MSIDLRPMGCFSLLCFLLMVKRNFQYLVLVVEAVLEYLIVKFRNLKVELVRDAL